jgi:HEAT repeat protein
MASDTDSFSQLIEQLGDPSQRLRLSRLHALSDLHGELLARFCTALDSFPVGRRRRLSRALLHLAEGNFALSFDAIFRHCLEDVDAVVRAIAVEGLHEEHDPRLIGPLLALLRSDPSARVRAAAAASLGRYVLAGELEELEPALEARIVSDLLATVSLRGESLDVRRRALESAAFSCSAGVAEALKQAYVADNDKMRLSAVLSMGRSCDSRWRPVLLRELRSDSAAMRYVAVLACGDIALAEAVPVLGEMLHTSDPPLLEAAIWALGQIGGTAARELLLDAYAGADEETQVALEEALAELAFSGEDSSLMPHDLDNVEDEEWLEDGAEYLWDNLGNVSLDDSGLDD